MQGKYSTFRGERIGCEKGQRQSQCLHYRILPSGLCAEICCNRGEKKDFPGRIGTFSGLILEQIGTFYRYLHLNAELLRIMRKHDNSISRREKVHQNTEVKRKAVLNEKCYIFDHICSLNAD